MQTRPISAIKVGKRHRKDLGDLEDSHFDDPARVHPCPEPLDQCEELIRSFTCEGALVLDPFCGVGTVPIAAVRSGRHFLVIDQTERLWKHADLRSRVTI